MILIICYTSPKDELMLTSLPLVRATSPCAEYNNSYLQTYSLRSKIDQCISVAVQA